MRNEPGVGARIGQWIQFIARQLAERHGPISVEEIDARYTREDFRIASCLHRPLPPLRSDGMTEDKALEVRRIFAAIDLAERYPEHDPMFLPDYWLPEGVG